MDHGTAPVTIGTLVAACAVAAVVSILVALAVLMGFRKFAAKPTASEKDPDVDNFGFHAMPAKVNAEDTMSALSVDMNY
jgi:hypothetical protein